MKKVKIFLFIIFASLFVTGLFLKADNITTSLKSFFDGNKTKFNVPTNVSLSDDYKASFTISNDILEVFAFNLYYKIEYNDVVKTGVLMRTTKNTLLDASDSRSSYDSITGTITYYVSIPINNVYIEEGFTNEEVQISYRVQMLENEYYLTSDYSEYSNSVTYSKDSSSYPLLNAPINPTLDNNYMASWIVTEDLNNEDFFSINIDYKIDCDGHSNYVTNMRPIIVSDLLNRPFSCGFGGCSYDFENNVVTINIESAIREAYLSLGYYDTIVNISYRLRSRVTSYESNHADSFYSDYSNSVLYSSLGNPNISSFTVLPDNPVVGVGKNITLNAIVQPIDAYYSSIEWSSSDSTVATVDSNGKVTGISKGTSTITATVNNVVQNVTVKVYDFDASTTDIFSNMAIDSAKDVISKIINNNDNSGTDITNVNSAFETINNAIQNGYNFGVEISTSEKNASLYDSVSNKIKSFVGNDYDIAGGYDINLELFYVDGNEQKNHITNITEINNKIIFTVSLSSDYPVVPNNKTREYRVVRLYGNEMQEIETVIFGTEMVFSTDRFSDFIVVYRDVENGTTPTSFDVENREITLEKWNDDDITSDISQIGDLGFVVTSLNEDIVQVTNGRIRAVGVGDAVVVISTEDNSFAIPITVHVVKRAVPIKGDVFDSGFVDAKDITIALKKLFRYEDTTDEDILAADINGNGEIDANDIVKMLKYVFKYTDTLE